MQPMTKYEAPTSSPICSCNDCRPYHNPSYCLPTLRLGRRGLPEDFRQVKDGTPLYSWDSQRWFLSGFFWSFPSWFPLLFFYPFLSPLLLTNQAPMISIKGGTGTVFILSLISEEICCTRQVFVFILGYYELRISTVPAKYYLLLAPVFELSIIVALSAASPS